MTVSFIIPAYNASNYIIRCLDSIFELKLSKEEFEVIVVDDCSTDNTCDIVTAYQAKHENITLLKQPKNNRQGAARNKGVRNAKGKYIVYVDSDDEVAQGIVQALELAEKNHLEMVAFHSQKVDENGMTTEYKRLPYLEKEIFTGIQLQTEHPYWFTGPVAYVYLKSFLDKVGYAFAEEVLFEDSDYVNNHLYYAQRIGYVSKCGYRIHYNRSSTTHTMSYKHIADYFLLGTRMLKLYDKIDDKTTTYATSIQEGGSYNIWMAFRRLWKLDSTEAIKMFYKRIDERADRAAYLDNKEPKYCWTLWTKLGLRHKAVMTYIVGLMIFCRKCLRTFKLYPSPKIDG